MYAHKAFGIVTMHDYLKYPELGEDNKEKMTACGLSYRNLLKRKVDGDCLHDGFNPFSTSTLKRICDMNDWRCKCELHDVCESNEEKTRICYEKRVADLIVLEHQGMGTRPSSFPVTYILNGIIVGDNWKYISEEDGKLWASSYGIESLEEAVPLILTEQTMVMKELIRHGYLFESRGVSVPTELLGEGFEFKGACVFKPTHLYNDRDIATAF